MEAVYYIVIFALLIFFICVLFYIIYINNNNNNNNMITEDNDPKKISSKKSKSSKPKKVKSAPIKSEHIDNIKTSIESEYSKCVKSPKKPEDDIVKSEKRHKKKTICPSIFKKEIILHNSKPIGEMNNILMVNGFISYVKWSYESSNSHKAQYIIKDITGVLSEIKSGYALVTANCYQSIFNYKATYNNKSLEITLLDYNRKCLNLSGYINIELTLCPEDFTCANIVPQQINQDCHIEQLKEQQRRLQVQQENLNHELERLKRDLLEKNKIIESMQKDTMCR